MVENNQVGALADSAWAGTGASGVAPAARLSTKAIISWPSMGFDK